MHTLIFEGGARKKASAANEKATVTGIRIFIDRADIKEEPVELLLGPPLLRNEAEKNNNVNISVQFSSTSIVAETVDMTTVVALSVI